MLKDLSRTFRWKTRYNPTEEIVHIITQDMPDITTMPIPVTEPTSQRLDGKIICLDAGHGGADGGSRGPNGTYEKDHTLAIAQQLRTLLEENGASVVMTRSSDDCPPDDITAVSPRIEIANDAKADFFLSIHADGFYPRPQSRGAIYYYQNESRSAAESLADALSAEFPATTSYGTFSVLRDASMTALWADVASLADPTEELLLASQDGRAKIASALYQGITHHFRV